MPFDAEEEITHVLRDYFITKKRAKFIMEVLGIEDIGNNRTVITALIESAPKNSSDEELIDHIAKHVQPDYQPTDPTFAVLQ